MRKKNRKKKLYRRERTRAVYVLLLYFSLYFLFVVLRGSRRPFEGAYAPQERGVPTPNSGTWYPKPHSGEGPVRAVVLRGFRCPFSLPPSSCDATLDHGHRHVPSEEQPRWRRLTLPFWTQQDVEPRAPFPAPFRRPGTALPSGGRT